MFLHKYLATNQNQTNKAWKDCSTKNTACISGQYLHWAGGRNKEVLKLIIWDHGLQTHAHIHANPHKGTVTIKGHN